MSRRGAKGLTPMTDVVTRIKAGMLSFIETMGSYDSSTY